MPLRQALRTLLRPLIRYLIGEGVTYPALCDWLQGLYVEEAAAMGGKAGRHVTDSQVALLSGVHRKEVARRRRNRELPLRPTEQASLAARVVAEWVTTDLFLDPQGEPRRLPLGGGESPSFEDLTRAVRADVRPRVVLDELLRAGVAVLEADHVVLRRLAYVADQPAEKLVFFANNVADHVAAATYNLSHADAPFVERAVYYDALDPSVIGRLRERLRALSERFIRDANTIAMPLDGTPGPGHSRMRLGVYYFDEPSDTPHSQDTHTDP